MEEAAGLQTESLSLTRVYDYVEVYNGGDEFSPMLGKFCGKIAPSPIISSGSQLLIKFVSDYETHGAGFSVRYEVFKTGPECSRNFTAPRGVIKTPGFPEKYPNNLDCTFMIFAPQMSEIVVEFDSFDMEPDTSPPPGALCRYDWLEIWDGFPADVDRKQTEIKTETCGGEGEEEGGQQRMDGFPAGVTSSD
ncbi:hypothetical protein PAMP_005286 [Pampus punctatissimus]